MAGCVVIYLFLQIHQTGAVNLICSPPLAPPIQPESPRGSPVQPAPSVDDDPGGDGWMDGFVLDKEKDWNNEFIRLSATSTSCFFCWCSPWTRHSESPANSPPG